MWWLAMTTALALDVRVTGVEGPGTVDCAAFDEEAGFPADHEKAVALDRVPASTAIEGAVVCRFPSISSGRVAISVRHDLDDNGKLDTTWVGVPKEPFGFSRDAPLRPFGPPRFEDALIDVTSSITITLRKLR